MIRRQLAAPGINSGHSGVSDGRDRRRWRLDRCLPDSEPERRKPDERLAQFTRDLERDLCRAVAARDPLLRDLEADPHCVAAYPLVLSRVHWVWP